MVGRLLAVAAGVFEERVEKKNIKNTPTHTSKESTR